MLPSGAKLTHIRLKQDTQAGSVSVAARPLEHKEASVNIYGKKVAGTLWNEFKSRRQFCKGAANMKFPLEVLSLILLVAGTLTQGRSV